MKKFLWFGLMFAFLFGCGSNETETSTEESEEGNDAEVSAGGELTVAYSAQPESLDPHLTLAVATRDISRNFFETLVTINSNYEIEPMLAESIEESDDGETITFHLREDVLFHNGEEMTADDVAASMNRWKELSNVGRSNLEDSEFTAVDEYIVELQLEEYSSVILHILAEAVQLAAIMPEEIAEEAGSSAITEYVGTGPFEFADWVTDQHIQLQRFDDYQPLNEPADGLAGSREALVENIYFQFVQDPSTRLSGLQTGEYDVIMEVPHDNAEQVEADPNLYNVLSPSGLQAAIFNEEKGLFTDVKAREAVNAAVDMNAILLSAYVDEEYYDAEPGLMLEDQVEWYTDAGAEHYNQNDPERAKELLDEIGYEDEEIVILVSRDYDTFYNMAVVLQQQLEEIGMNAQLNVVDWPTYLEEAKNPDAYEIAITSFSPRMVPHQYPTLSARAEYDGWTKSTELDDLLDKISDAETEEERFAANVELQEQFYEDLPMLNVGKIHDILGVNNRVDNLDELMGPIFWNVTIEE